MAVGAALLLAAALPASAGAQCNEDPTPRLLWSYPAEGETVGRFTPVLLRYVGSPTSLPMFTADTADAGTVFLQPWIDTSFSPLVFQAFSIVSPADTTVQMSMPLGGATIELSFNTLATAFSPTQTGELDVRGHWVGRGVELPSERCREIIFSRSPDGCWGPDRVSVGFDVELVEVRTDGTRRPSGLTPHAFAVISASPIAGSSLPRIWPAECGPPRVFALLEDIDRSDVCVSVVAFVDGFSFQQQAVRSAEYCLGEGMPWPPPPPVDAGVAAFDAGVRPPFAGTAGWPGMPGLCGCNCPFGCEGAGTGWPGPEVHSAGTGAVGSTRRNDPVSGTASDAAVTDAGAHGAISADPGCDCRIGSRSPGRGWGLAGLCLCAIALRVRRRVD